MLERVLEDALALRADVELWKRGLDWYPEARLAIQQLASIHGVEYRRAAAVVALLSPSCPWEGNLYDAARLLRAWSTRTPPPPVRTYGPNRAKAWLALCLPRPERLFGPQSLKTYRFYLNLTDPEHPGVTLDRHMLRYLRGLGFQGRLTPKRYRELEGVFQEAARELAVRPHELQAAFWLGIKGGKLGGVHRGGGGAG